MWPGRRWRALFVSALAAPACTAFLTPQPSAPLRGKFQSPLIIGYAHAWVARLTISFHAFPAARVGPLLDASMIVDFQLNDTVRVKPGIILDAKDWSGKVGRVTSLWSKCDTDPACCCAELSTEGAIRVEFSDDSSYQFFAENEIEKI